MRRCRVHITIYWLCFLQRWSAGVERLIDLLPEKDESKWGSSPKPVAVIPITQSAADAKNIIQQALSVATFLRHQGNFL